MYGVVLLRMLRLVMKIIMGISGREPNPVLQLAMITTTLAMNELTAEHLSAMLIWSNSWPLTVVITWSDQFARSAPHDLDPPHTVLHLIFISSPEAFLVLVHGYTTRCNSSGPSHLFGLPIWNFLVIHGLPGVVTAPCRRCQLHLQPPIVYPRKPLALFVHLAMHQPDCGVSP